MARIITVGAAVQDVFLSHSPALAPVCESPEHCFQRLELGSKADVNQIHFSTGGGATNAAVTFARQGHQVQFMGIVGRDPAGQAVLDALDSESVGTQLVKFSDHYNTGYSVLLLAPNGERTILTYRGASTHYHPADFSLAGVQADWLYVSNVAGQMAVLAKLCQQAKQQGIKIACNPGKKELAQAEWLRRILADVDVLALNKQEICQLVGPGELEDLVQRGLELVPTVLVTDGSNGSVASDGRTMVRAGLYEDEPSVDRTGAGDAFAAGFISRWMCGATLATAVQFASANASAVVAHIGAKAGILRQGVQPHAMPLTETPITPTVKKE